MEKDQNLKKKLILFVLLISMAAVFDFTPSVGGDRLNGDFSLKKHVRPKTERGWRFLR